MSGRPRTNRLSSNYRLAEPVENLRIRLRIVQHVSDILVTDAGNGRDSSFLEQCETVLDWRGNFCPDGSEADQEEESGQKIFVLHGEAPNETESVLARRNRMAEAPIRNRKSFEDRSNKNVVEEWPDRSLTSRSHFVYTDTTRFRVMADLSPSRNGGPDSETHLCTVAYDRYNRILTMAPDFSGPDTFYTVVNGSGVRFDYWIEDVSPKPTNEDLDRKREEARRELRQRFVYKQSELSNGLRCVPPKRQRIFLNLTIHSARGFAYDGLFVAYHVDLPDSDWTGSEIGGKGLHGRTQRSSLKKGCGYFGYTVDLALDVRVDDAGGPRIGPRILLCVASLDGWTRYRTEGYGCVAVPTKAGVYDLEVATWRPGGSLWNSLRRFFTGGTYQLDDLSSASVPRLDRDRSLDRSGLRIDASGTVKLRINVARQCSGKDSFQPFVKGSNDKLMDSVENVFEEFKIARERMLRVRALNF